MARSVDLSARTGCLGAPGGWISLLDLTGEGALAIGATGTLQWGDEPRRRTRRWARRIYEQYAELDGVRYQAANQGGECVVLWQRAPALQRSPGGTVGSGPYGAGSWLR